MTNSNIENTTNQQDQLASSTPTDNDTAATKQNEIPEGVRQFINQADLYTDKPVFNEAGPGRLIPGDDFPEGFPEDLKKIFKEGGVTFAELPIGEPPTNMHSSSIHNGISTYQVDAHRTAFYRQELQVMYPLLKLGAEVGELQQKFAKALRDESDEKDHYNDPEFRKAVASEIGDILWYLSALATDMNMCLGCIAEKNLEKLADRKARGVLKGSGDNR